MSTAIQIRSSLRNHPHLFLVLLSIIAIFAVFQISQDNQIESAWLHGLTTPSFFGRKNDVVEDKSVDSKHLQFVYTKQYSPYEEIWVNNRLPNWAKKRRQFRKIEHTIPAEERICFVHVGKAGGSSVGCSLGFSLHCTNQSQPLPGLLPQRTTRMFHADTYDCHDDSAYFLFVIRDPVDRIRSAFLYERPWNEETLKKFHPNEYDRRKAFFIDCSYYYMEDYVQRGLTKHGDASEECKMKAFTALWGVKHYSCHFFFNYQFHLEGIPKGAKILVIRNEHLVDDWNGVEEYIGGEKEVIPSNHSLPVMNGSQKNPRDKYLSKEGRKIVCRQLCNEIINYKMILRRAVNLSPADVDQSMKELRKSCPHYADIEACPNPMPDIEEKLINTRGYVDKVMIGSYLHNKGKLESGEPVTNDANDGNHTDDEFTDDGYQLR
mmetsp:Transcript_27123/g.55774  ORF Transcript_27123/g.55774 Transcript_27123/m.55774 type:complete len:434 (+) Transcript_27123:74-1375(+)